MLMDFHKKIVTLSPEHNSVVFHFDEIDGPDHPIFDMISAKDAYYLGWMTKLSHWPGWATDTKGLH